MDTLGLTVGDTDCATKSEKGSQEFECRSICMALSNNHDRENRLFHAFNSKFYI